MWDAPPEPTQNAGPVANAGGQAPPLKRDLTAMMYGGATPLFGGDALDGDNGDEGKKSKPSAGGGMFDDDSDDNGEAFL